jgi:hypothetical protein
MTNAFVLSQQSVLTPHYTVTIKTEYDDNNCIYPVYIHDFGFKSDVVNRLFHVQKEMAVFATETHSGYVNGLKIGKDLQKFFTAYEFMMGKNIVKRQVYYNRLEYTIQNIEAIGQFAIEYPQESILVEVEKCNLILTSNGPISYEVEQIFNTLSDKMSMEEVINPNQMKFKVEPEFFHLNSVVIDILRYLNTAGFEITTLYSNEFCIELKKSKAVVTPIGKMVNALQRSDFKGGAENILKDYQPEDQVKREKPYVYNGII